jgi:CarD family transcriptional regulator
VKFTVGDGIVHPGHGAGTIVGLEDIDFVDGFERYYVINILSKDLLVRVPVRMAQELGLRAVSPKANLKVVAAHVLDAPKNLSNDYKVRRAKLEKKLKTGRPLNLAEVIRDLTFRQVVQHLSPTDGRLLDEGRAMLAAEMALVNGIDIEAAQSNIDQWLNEIRQKLSQTDPLEQVAA